MGSRKKSYDREFKMEAVRLVEEKGRAVSSVAHDLGIGTNKTLYRWIEEYRSHQGDAFPGSGKRRPEDEDVKQLKKRIADLEEENKILKGQRPSSQTPGNKVSIY